MCLEYCADSLMFGWKLWPQLRVIRKPTWDCLGDCMSGKRGRMLGSETSDLALLLRFEELLLYTGFILAWKYSLTRLTHTCKHYNGLITLLTMAKI